MAIESNNPGYIAAVAYNADPANVATPNPIHVESMGGLMSYILSTIGGGGGGGLPEDGDGTFTTTADIGAINGGLAKDAGGTQSSTGEGSINLGQVSGTGSKVADDDGSINLGYCEGGSMSSQGDGSAVIGYCGPTNTVAATSVGSIAIGAATNLSSVLSATGQGSLAGGLASGGDDIRAQHNGAFQWGIGTTDAASQFQVGAGVLKVNFAVGSELVGLFGAAGAGQAAKINDPSGGATVDAEARTAIDAIIDVLEGVGLSAAA